MIIMTWLVIIGSVSQQGEPIILTNGQDDEDLDASPINSVSGPMQGRLRGELTLTK